MLFCMERLIDSRARAIALAALLIAANAFAARAQDNATVWRDVETKYYQRTGIFPIMHLIVIKRDIYERHPWLAYSLYKAFAESKEICAREMGAQSALKYMLPWMIPELEETTRIMGEDYWPYGLEANRKTLEAFIGYNTEQGLVESLFKAEDLFAPEAVNVAKI